ncbi:Menaquinone biosynthesis family protein [Desulfonema limicola]|uniref:1,4-dihydroxy-6-naphtoate synthase n=1 Tax=Desulfonema limicola TaxID=45656 RepID=A0A975BDV7_9BACT|nr:1,4-dihydroxy-6-naphthoate synthase [Desulfonema limicola]QTA83450.1 Menaquinone biosynthesis family protein [Desulfonema limicola]
MKKKLSLGYSPCPNDTFIFYALAHNKIDLHDLEFSIKLEDVETLNQYAKKGMLDISKLSFAAIGHVQETYALLRSGAALGRGCGPLIVAKKGIELSDLKNINIAVPGMWTTACLLLRLFLETQPKIRAMTFDQIMPGIARGDFDAGVIIHEGRFTYENYGLTCLADLGQWWEQKKSLPIPLGGIAIRRDIDLETAIKVQTAIHESTAYAFSHKNETDEYIQSHAQEMSDHVIKQHIELYVNDFTLNLDHEGETAVNTLFKEAENLGIIPRHTKSLFAC